MITAAARVIAAALDDGKPKTVSYIMYARLTC